MPSNLISLKFYTVEISYAAASSPLGDGGKVLAREEMINFIKVSNYQAGKLHFCFCQLSARWQVWWQGWGRFKQFFLNFDK